MVVKNSIVHLLKKERNGQPSLSLRDELLTTDDNLLGLLSSLRKVYNDRTGRGYGAFHDDLISYPFSRMLSEYNSAASSFVNFTKAAMRFLQAKVTNEQFATGGYVLFSNYHEGEREYLVVASIKHRPGLAFDDKLNLTGAIQLDLDRLHEMARVDVTGWLDGADRYLSFAKQRIGDKFSTYFRDFVGCAEFANATSMNNLVLSAIKAFGTNEGYDQKTQSNLREITYNYFEEKARAGELISLSMLSKRINEDKPDAFLTFINERPEKYSISDGFDPIKSIYKRLKVFQMKSGSVTIQFEQKDFGTQVILKQDGCLEIRDLKPEFLAELKEFKKDG